MSTKKRRPPGRRQLATPKGQKPAEVADNPKDAKRKKNANLVMAVGGVTLVVGLGLQYLAPDLARELTWYGLTAIKVVGIFVLFGGWQMRSGKR